MGFTKVVGVNEGVEHRCEPPGGRVDYNNRMEYGVGTEWECDYCGQPWVLMKRNNPGSSIRTSYKLWTKSGRDVEKLGDKRDRRKAEDATPVASVKSEDGEILEGQAAIDEWLRRNGEAGFKSLASVVEDVQGDGESEPKVRSVPDLPPKRNPPEDVHEKLRKLLAEKERSVSSYMREREQALRERDRERARTLREAEQAKTDMVEKATKKESVWKRWF